MQSEASNTDTLSLIIQHGLTVRQIPHSVTEKWGYREGAPLMQDAVLIEDNGRTFQKRVRVPANAGMWMAKPCKDTSAMVRWNIKRDNLSDTLDAAVKKAVADIQAREHASQEA